MAVDPYAPCPCGSGKKLKFCCSDLFTEIDKVHRMLEGDQPRAALKHLEQTLAKTPDRASLLDLKASIELSLGDFEAAEQTIQRYVSVDPQNASAHAQAALLAASNLPGDRAASADDDAPRAEAGRAAAEHLQSALELVDEAIPARVLQAVGAVGQAMLAAGNLIAARAHLWLYQGITGEEDTRAMELLMQLNRVSGLPLVLRDNLYLREAPLGHACEAQHDHAQMLASRGQWRRAATLMDELSEQHSDLPMLVYNAALVHGWLGEQQRLVDGLRKFAAAISTGADAPPDDAVEAEAIAQLLDEEHRESPTEVVRIVYDVSNEDALIDRLGRDAHVTPHRLNDSELQAIDGPPPRQVYLLLDRPLPETGVEIQPEHTPRIVGVVSYFGRQTDRAERLELVTDRDERVDETKNVLTGVAGDAIAAPGDEAAIGRSSSDSLRSRWRFPDDTPSADRRRVVAAEQRRVLLEEWPEKPRAALGDASPREASADPAKRLALAGSLLLLEQTASGAVDEATFAELRQAVGAPARATIDAPGIDPETLPLSRVAQLDTNELSDDAVFALYKRAEMCGAEHVTVELAKVALERPGLAGDLSAPELYARLISLEPDPADALHWVGMAREATAETATSDAAWDLLELELRVVENQVDEANRLVHHLRDEHLNEPGVAERLYAMLGALGAVPAEGPVAEEGAAEAEAAPASKLWTPDSDAPAGGGGGGQKIWTPS